MSARLAWTIRPNSYFDSIDLMQIAEQVRQLTGVLDVAIVMGTPAGRSMLEEAGLWSSEAPEAGRSDLLVAVRAEGEPAGGRGLGWRGAPRSTRPGCPVCRGWKSCRAPGAIVGPRATT